MFVAYKVSGMEPCWRKIFLCGILLVGAYEDVQDETLKDVQNETLLEEGILMGNIMG